MDDLSSENFAQQTLGFHESVSLDLDKVVVGGHSFGGMTAIMVSHHDPRVKATFGFDPWLWVVVDKIREGDFSLEQPQMHVVTEHFNPICLEWFEFDTVKELQRMYENKRRPEQELIVLNETNHYHQCDAIMMIPLESFVKGGNKIQLNYPDLLLLNTKAVLQFLDKIGFNNAYQYKTSFSK